jgi:hypothetical protein
MKRVDRHRVASTPVFPVRAQARIWGRPQARTSEKCEEHLRVGAGREAEAEEVTAEQIVKRVFEVVEVP